MTRRCRRGLAVDGVVVRRARAVSVMHVRAAALVHPQRHPAFIHLGGLHARGQEPGMLDGLAVDPEVDQEDDAERNVEGGGDGEEDVASLRGHRALVGVGAGGVLPAHQRRDGDGHSQEPDENDDVDGAALRHDGGALQRPRDADVTVYGNDAQ